MENTVGVQRCKELAKYKNTVTFQRVQGEINRNSRLLGWLNSMSREGQAQKGLREFFGL